jgi:hypothetical protein
MVGVAIYMHISTVDVTEPPQPLDYESTTAGRTIGRRPYIVAGPTPQERRTWRRGRRGILARAAWTRTTLPQTRKELSS